MDPGVVRRARRAFDVHANVGAQLVLGAAPLAGPPRRFAGRPHRGHRQLHDLAVQAELVAEVIVDRRHVRARLAADLAHADPLEPALGKQPRPGLHQPLAGLLIACRHSVLLKSMVAAVMATTEKAMRYRRSPPIATKPVFFRSRLFNAWTE